MQARAVLQAFGRRAPQPCKIEYFPDRKNRITSIRWEFITGDDIAVNVPNLAVDPGALGGENGGQDSQ